MKKIVQAKPANAIIDNSDLGFDLINRQNPISANEISVIHGEITGGLPTGAKALDASRRSINGPKFPVCKFPSTKAHIVCQGPLLACDASDAVVYSGEIMVNAT